jgi:hypothetical protein
MLPSSLSHVARIVVDHRHGSGQTGPRGNIVTGKAARTPSRFSEEVEATTLADETTDGARYQLTSIARGLATILALDGLRIRRRIVGNDGARDAGGWSTQASTGIELVLIHKRPNWPAFLEPPEQPVIGSTILGPLQIMTLPNNPDVGPATNLNHRAKFSINFLIVPDPTANQQAEVCFQSFDVSRSNPSASTRPNAGPIRKIETGILVVSVQSLKIFKTKRTGNASLEGGLANVLVSQNLIGSLRIEAEFGTAADGMGLPHVPEFNCCRLFSGREGVPETGVSEDVFHLLN